MWVQAAGGWRSFPAPSGQLTGGALLGDRVVWVIDDLLFTGRLPAGLAPSGG